MKHVALLAEGVDRNLQALPLPLLLLPSPSSRRAWIEIYAFEVKRPLVGVALLAEGVDRNLQAEGVYVLLLRRPPRGGRG